METPSVPVGIVRAEEGDTFEIFAGATCRVVEDGKRTDNRVSIGEFSVPAKSAGTMPHWHEMHDEIFIVTKGCIRFHAKDGTQVDAKAGDCIVVPPRAPHAFENPFEEEARMYTVFTPAFYINYFELLGEWNKDGTMSGEKIKEAMSKYATMGVRGPW